jgi:hypothetical protein
MDEEAMPNMRESDRSPVGSFRSQLGWLLVVLLAAGGVLLAVLEIGAWLALAIGVLAAFAIVALLRPGTNVASTSFIRSAETGWGYMRTELARSRRHDRRFALVGIPTELWSPSTATPTEMGEVGLEAAGAVQRIIRRPDRAWVDGSLLHVLLTDCDRQKGLAFLARAKADMPHLFGDDRVKLVVFPDDGITTGALLAGLESDGVEAAEPAPSGEGIAQ